MNKNEHKVIAYYLPQFHQIPENDKFWGEGFTEWVNVKKAKPLFENHYQPRVPLKNNYYDLSDTEVLKWQAQIAKGHGLYGFCFYHYWFYEKPILEKPLYNFLNNADIDIKFCFSWANESWTNAWSSADRSVIMEQKYGDSNEWKRHFDFLLPFFKDERYIKENDMPLLIIYRPYLCDCIIEMLDYWKELAKENGFAGLKIASQRYEDSNKARQVYDYMDYHIEYQPDYDKCHFYNNDGIIKKLKKSIKKICLEQFNIDLHINKKNQIPTIFNYDDMWKEIISMHPNSQKAIAGGFVDWDNTPRHGVRGTCFDGVTPEKFEMYLRMQLKHIDHDYDNKYLFLFAWNEWGEGGYLEPDEKYKNAFLQALSRALNQSTNSD